MDLGVGFFFNYLQQNKAEVGMCFFVMLVNMVNTPYL